MLESDGFHADFAGLHSLKCQRPSPAEATLLIPPVPGGDRPGLNGAEETALDGRLPGTFRDALRCGTSWQLYSPILTLYVG
jgi:hypothetical protein